MSDSRGGGLSAVLVESKDGIKGGAIEDEEEEDDMEIDEEAIEVLFFVPFVSFIETFVCMLSFVGSLLDDAAEWTVF